MNDIRKKKLEGAILKEAANLIMKEKLRDDGIGLVSVTSVSLTPDLSTMTIFVSPFGGEEDNKETWSALLRRANFFQSTISRNLRLRQTPKLWFKIDNSIKEGDDMYQRLDETAEGSPENFPDNTGE